MFLVLFEKNGAFRDIFQVWLLDCGKSLIANCDGDSILVSFLER
jgi:hypothetical protein